MARCGPFLGRRRGYDAVTAVVFAFLLCLIVPSFRLPRLCFLAFADGSGRRDLRRVILRDEATARLNVLGKISDAEDHLERTFMSPASLRAGNQIHEWMEDAGMRTWNDGMGNVHGRVDGRNPSGKALLIGSHLDTVVDAGIFDGSLGLISAISALKLLNVTGKSSGLERPVEVIAFSDEEGIRFQSTFLGSAAIAGILPPSILNFADRSGATVRDVLMETVGDTSEKNLRELKYDPNSVWGYVEVHIEQGPVLEWRGLPLGIVSGIAGQTRLRVTVRGSQGHAGTVPMSMRQDPMPAAAELIVLLESLCKHPVDFLSFDEYCKDSTIEVLANSLVCTVGEISSWPSASNVIPGRVSFTIDIRAMEDKGREAVIYELSSRMYKTCDRRSVICTIERKHDANAVKCDPELSTRLKLAAQTAMKEMNGGMDQQEVPVLMSGAGHDAMAMSHLTKVGMIFVRCRGGVSHSPEEHVLDDDVWAAGLATLTFLESQIGSPFCVHTM
ncbi:hypothetical protein MLD38_000834 [Melastoma candidum]|uniref:Uncharacterized protein n=1 Tax=Melastoma candidum TaxID=119954 RepID=A0ACB9SBE6_9MYRT|nr:hypothetical protein MLD38_000834 [Melastoma candidum]